VTVALGILAGSGIVVAADTEESIGHDKLDALKTSAAFPLPSGTSGLVITGAGNGWYIDAITQELEKCHEMHDGVPMDQLEREIKKTLRGFYKKHVIPFSDVDELDFQLIIGVQRSGITKLWVTFRNSMRDAYEHEVVGSGDVEAKILLRRVNAIDTVQFGVLAACCAVYQAKQRIRGCGKSTTVICLHDNQPHYIYQDVILMAEQWFEKYLGVSSSSLVYAMGRYFPDEHVFGERISEWHSELRAESKGLLDRISNDLKIVT
jgi:hypothetical protein